MCCMKNMLVFVVLLTSFFSTAVYSQDSDVRAPYIRFPPEDIDVSKGDEIRLKCFVYGKPTPTVTWYKDGVMLKENVADGRTIEVDKTLVIQKARRNSRHDDSGVYYCYAENDAGSETSKKALVKVKFLSKPFVENPRNATVSIHMNHVMRCKAPAGYPQPTIEWLKDDQPLQPRPRVVEVKSNGNESEIQFTRITWESRGVYKCVAKNGEKVERVSLPAVITVKVIKPDLFVFSNLVEIFVGKPATLQCSNKFKPEPLRTWSKTGGLMPRENRLQYQVDKTSLLITDVQLSDAGEYKCKASNAAGEATLAYQLVVYENVQFVVQPTGLQIGKGRTARFDCIVKGGKKGKVVWNYDVYYQPGTSVGRVSVDRNDNSLVIRNVEANDMKNKVQCIADDGSDRKFADYVSLQVIDSADAPPSITALPQVVKVEGSKLVVPCTSSSSGTLTFEWFSAKNNAPVNLGADEVWIAKDASSANLTFNNVLVTDSGAYRCKVTSSSGSASAVTMVTINLSDGETPPKVPNVNVVNTWSTMATLTWSRPQTVVLAPILSYVINIKVRTTGSSRKTTVPDGDLTTYNITGLSPLTLYAVSIFAVNKNGDGVETDFPNVDTPRDDPTNPNKQDRLENVLLTLTIGAITPDTIEVKWIPEDPSRVKGYIIYYRAAGKSLFVEKEVMSPTASSYVLRDLKRNTRYELEIKALNDNYYSNPSQRAEATTLRKILIAVQNVQVTKYRENVIMVGWKFPSGISQAHGIDGVNVSVTHSSSRKIFKTSTVPVDQTVVIFHGLDPDQRYYVSVAVLAKGSMMKKSQEISFRLLDMEIDEIVPPPISPDKGEKTKGESDVLAIVKEPWFIATIGVLVWLLLLAIVVLICCRRKKKQNAYRDHSLHDSRGLLANGQRNIDYPNTSLNRSRLQQGNERPYYANPPKRKFCGCCHRNSSGSMDGDFPNRADIKPFTGYVRHDNMEMRQKGAYQHDSLMKENNLGIAMRNGYKIDAPLNNELDGYRQNSIDNRMYPGTDRSRMPQAHMGVGTYREQVAPPYPGSGSMSRRNDARVKQDSVDRRLGEIVRTNKHTPEDDVNVMDANQQASWKREPKPKETPKINPKPPGENTLRRQGKTQFKPLPDLEVLKWADGLPASSKAASTNGSPPGSPKTATSVSAISEAEHPRADSRLESHGGSSNSLNKYHRRRRNSNASSMMSSELYQSEMDPSGYSDVVSDRKKRKEKAIPPPIDFEGLTSDILLQWAESVTNSSPSSSGSSSPSRLSGISSEGSLYTDEDFAQAVAAVAECGGFNMDYDYSLPGMNMTPAPLSSTRNSKMDKIDKVFAQRSKPRNPLGLGATSKSGSRPDTSTPQNYVPQISMSNYLTGSQKGPHSTHGSSIGNPRALKPRGERGDKNNLRYGTGFDDVGSVSSSATKPLTVSNLLQHDSSLDREKKPNAKPLTVSNLRQHETSLDRDRDRRPKPITYDKPPPYHESITKNGYRDSNPLSQQPNAILPEAALSVTSALERHESMNSKDSLNSSNKHDSEIENNVGTSERRQRRIKKNLGNRDPQSSTSTVNTVHTSPDNESNC